MENYFYVPKVLGGQEPGVKIGILDPLKLLVPAPLPGVQHHRPMATNQTDTNLLLGMRAFK